MPEGVVPGEALKFATTLSLSGFGRGVIVTSIDGRPIKVEGNPRHPASLGATDVFRRSRGAVAVRSGPLAHGAEQRRDRFPRCVPAGAAAAAPADAEAAAAKVSGFSPGA